MAASKSATAPRAQYAALPYRLKDDGRVEVLLITSRETVRWVIPKGWPMKGRTPHGAAAQEALEEAGVVGRVSKHSIGCYNYRKRLKSGRIVPCNVEVFPLLVSRQRKTWPEQNDRNVAWLSTSKAALAVREPELKKIIRKLKSAITIDAQ